MNQQFRNQCKEMNLPQQQYFQAYSLVSKIVYEMKLDQMVLHLLNLSDIFMNSLVAKYCQGELFYLNKLVKILVGYQIQQILLSY